MSDQQEAFAALLAVWLLIFIAYLWADGNVILGLLLGATGILLPYLARQLGVQYPPPPSTQITG